MQNGNVKQGVDVNTGCIAPKTTDVATAPVIDRTFVRLEGTKNTPTPKLVNAALYPHSPAETSAIGTLYTNDPIKLPTVLPIMACNAKPGEYDAIAANIPAPVHADWTTNICDKPVSGDSRMSSAETVEVEVMSTASDGSVIGVIDFGASGWTRSNAASITKLNAYVHCGMGGHILFNIAVVIAAAAALVIVNAVVASTKLLVDVNVDDKKTEDAQPIKQPL
jgi:hypothetical protein